MYLIFSSVLSHIYIRFFIR